MIDNYTEEQKENLKRDCLKIANRLQDKADMLAEQVIDLETTVALISHVIDGDDALTMQKLIQIHRDVLEGVTKR